MPVIYQPLQYEMERDILEVDGYVTRVVTWQGTDYACYSAGLEQAVIISADGNPERIERSLRLHYRDFNQGDGPFPQSGDVVTYLGKNLKVVLYRPSKHVFFWIDLISVNR